MSTPDQENSETAPLVEFTGEPIKCQQGAWRKLRRPNWNRLRDPSGYLSGPGGLVGAVNTAITLGMPLLLTGDPGVGKSQAAWAIAYELDMGKPLVFETKSTSEAKDLFYSLDTLARFNAAHWGNGQQVDPRRFITFAALGEAILRTQPWDKIAHLFLEGEGEWNRFHPGTAEEEKGSTLARRSVVLVDEIDKAPRDFPNDILNEIECMRFRIPELSTQVEADPQWSPVTIFTSNGERPLPDAFLRRCVFHHIEMPTGKHLHDIIAQRVQGFGPEAEPLLRDVLALFHKARNEAGVVLDETPRKKPGLAELLQWLTRLQGQKVPSDRGLDRDPKAPWRGDFLALFFKNSEDLKIGERILHAYLKEDRDKRQENDELAAVKA